MRARDNAHRSIRDESGFTLVELLVVMLVLALLAAIAISSFFNQTAKARDANAKAAARSAETAMEAYATDNDGSYDGADAAALRSIEQTLNDADLSAVSEPATVGALPGDTADNSYTVTVSSDNDPNTFSITRHHDGTSELTCAVESSDGCPSGGNWG